MGLAVTSALSGASTSFRPLRLQIEIGTRTVTVQSSSPTFGLAIMLPFAPLV